MTDRLPSSDHHCIESITIEKGAFFGDACFELAAGLNCFIGTTGSGKTSAAYHARFGLGVDPEEGNEGLIQGTLGSGRVTVAVRTKHGVRYTSQRSVGTDPCVRDADGKVTTATLGGELFSVDAYGQSQIEQMAKSPTALLALIDNFRQIDISRASDSIVQLERRLALGAGEIQRLEEEIAAAVDQTATLPTIEATLAGITASGGGDPVEMKRAHAAALARGHEHAAMDRLAKEVATIDAAVKAVFVDARRRIDAAVEGDVEQGAHGAIFTRAHASVRKASHLIDRAASALRAELTTAAASIAVEQRALHAVHADEAEAYKTLLLRHETDLVKAADRERLQKECVALGIIAKQLDEKRATLATRQAERDALRLDLQRQRRARFELRASIAKDLTDRLDGDIRVTVTEDADIDAYAALLTEILHGQHLRTEAIRALAREIHPADLVRFVREGNPDPIMAVDEVKSGRLGRAHKIIGGILASGRALELETIDLGDRPLIELRADGVYQSAAEVSFGERCTAILPILFLQSPNPLIIDQPEDHLANEYVFDVLVKAFLRVKQYRQIIVITHNANIPVLADADRVFVLRATARRGRIAEVGRVDELSTTVERLLEGGAPAFLSRAERYGHTGLRRA